MSSVPPPDQPAEGTLPERRRRAPEPLPVIIEYSPDDEATRRLRIEAIKWVLTWAAERRARQGDDGAVPPAAPPTTAPKPRRRRRPSPSRLAKWEAHWQADAAETES